VEEGKEEEELEQRSVGGKEKEKSMTL